MSVEDLIAMLDEHRNMLVRENKIKHPEYDPYCPWCGAKMDESQQT